MNNFKWFEKVLALAKNPTSTSNVSKVKFTNGNEPTTRLFEFAFAPPLNRIKVTYQKWEKNRRHESESKQQMIPQTKLFRMPLGTTTTIARSARVLTDREVCNWNQYGCNSLWITREFLSSPAYRVPNQWLPRDLSFYSTVASDANLT